MYTIYIYIYYPSLYIYIIYIILVYHTCYHTLPVEILKSSDTRQNCFLKDMSPRVQMCKQDQSNLFLGRFQASMACWATLLERKQMFSPLDKFLLTPLMPPIHAIPMGGRGSNVTFFSHLFNAHVTDTHIKARYSISYLNIMFCIKEFRQCILTNYSLNC